MSILYAFLIGGVFCVIAQVLIDLTNLTPARILVIYVCFGVFLGAVGLFEPLLKLSGCGVSVPLIGFGGAIAKGVYEGVKNGNFLAVFISPLSSSAGGICSALSFGYLSAVLFKSHPKRAM